MRQRNDWGGCDAEESRAQEKTDGAFFFLGPPSREMVSCQSSPGSGATLTFPGEPGSWWWLAEGASRGCISPKWGPSEPSLRELRCCAPALSTPSTSRSRLPCVPVGAPLNWPRHRGQAVIGPGQTARTQSQSWQLVPDTSHSRQDCLPVTCSPGLLCPPIHPHPAPFLPSLP